MSVSQHVSGSFDGLTSYQRLCVNFPWAATNRPDVTARSEHKQASLCRNATAGMRHGNSAAPSAPDRKWRREGDEGYLAVMHIHAATPGPAAPIPQPARTPQGPSAFINGN